VLKATKPGESDFIHANKIDGGPLFNTFILTQAPMKSTLLDFWRMVWQEKAQKIFLLIGFGENEERCFRFWPAE
jgi:protein tyrosine phosphatase